MRGKFDALGWLNNSIDLVSRHLAMDMIKTFKKLVSQPEDANLRKVFVTATHGSIAAISVVRSLN